MDAMEAVSNARRFSGLAGAGDLNQSYLEEPFVIAALERKPLRGCPATI